MTSKTKRSIADSGCDTCSAVAGGHAVASRQRLLQMGAALGGWGLRRGEPRRRTPSQPTMKLNELSGIDPFTTDL
eukprot:scaffold109257_cov34-Tisochrysis_lutea.AAC.6